MRDFKELKVWEKGHRLTLAVYDATAGFPREELYGLTSQMRCSCVSAPTNIAELARFPRIASGSASELEYHLLLTRDLSLLDPSNHERLSKEVTEVKRMLTSFIQKLTAES